MRILLPALIISLIFSCASSEPGKTPADSVKTATPVQLDFKKGDFTDLSVNGDPDNIFSVYLPVHYDSTKKYPVVFFFDAHADGKLPMNKYKSIADKWNYIFVGSNTSKNGMASDYTMKIGDELINTVKNILPVDASEIIICGFSGGSRVASNIAVSRSDIKALICNSAAPSEFINGRIYVGLAGLGDMNYLEMEKYMRTPGSTALTHELLVFDGKHEWAPAGIMEDALLISSISPMNGTNNPQSGEMFRALGISIFHQSDSIKKTSCMIAHNLLETGMRAQNAATKGNQRIVTDDDYRIPAVKKDACVTSDEKAWEAAEAQESVLQNELGQALISQDTTWWKNNSPHYFESDKPGADKFMHERLRGYASLMAYSYANQAFKTNNLHAAEKLIAIYAIVDPTNSEWAYMQAQLYVKIGMNDYALTSLNKAVEIGFNDKQRMQNDPVFAGISGDPGFAAVLGKMK